MIVDGKKLAEEILANTKETVQRMEQRPHLTIFTCAPNFATQKYLSMKQSRATEAGIETNVIELSEDTSTEDMVCAIEKVGESTDGIVVQLPVPEQIDTNRVLQAIPTRLDVDGMQYLGGDTLLPPVVAAIAHIAMVYGVSFADKQLTVVGEGRLVGRPAAAWARTMGAAVTVVTKATPVLETTAALQRADIIITGAGQAGFITPDLVKEHAVIFDAGTSEDSGILKGDVNLACAEKATLFTPVPGGIGPLTIACLLQNVVEVAERA